MPRIIYYPTILIFAIYPSHVEAEKLFRRPNDRTGQVKNPSTYLGGVLDILRLSWLFLLTKTFVRLIINHGRPKNDGCILN